MVQSHRDERERLKERRASDGVLYRHTEMPEGIEWVKEGHWAVSLGVPIGNELDHEKWWEKKLEAVRELSKRWGGLFRTGYFALRKESSCPGYVPWAAEILAILDTDAS